MKDTIISEKQAVNTMKKIGVMHGGIKIMKDKAVFRLVMLDKVISPLANLIKEEMLAAGGDAAIHKDAISRRVETTGIILMGTLAQYKRFVQKMNKQPYGSKYIAQRVKKVLKL